jgi:nitrous oxidase accessory protein NosD
LVQGEIYFCVEKDKLPGDYALTYAAKETGITLYYVEQVAILDLVVQGFRVDGINAKTVRSVQIKGVTSRGNGRYGIAVDGAAQVDIEDCTLGQNGRGQLFTAANSETHLRGSDLFPLTAPAWVDEGGLFYLNDKRRQGGLEKISREEIPAR